MPKTKRKAVLRKNVRIPEPLVDEVDGIVRKRGLYINRQQFIESAIREKVEKFRLVEEREATAEVLSREVDEEFLVHVKETFLAHTIISIVKEGTLPASHLDVKQFEERVRQFLKKTVELEGREITRKRLDELTGELLEYHKRVVEGLGLMRQH